jgi:hypothetical protein
LILGDQRKGFEEVLRWSLDARTVVILRGAVVGVFLAAVVEDVQGVSGQEHTKPVRFVDGVSQQSGREHQSDCCRGDGGSRQLGRLGN